MSIEENLIAKSRQTDKSTKLQKELDQALALAKSYELLIADLKHESSNSLKIFTHDLSNPLQILSMTIESLQDNPSADTKAALERMKRATDNMISIILNIRKIQSSVNAGIKVI